MNCSQIYIGLHKKIDDIKSELFSVEFIDEEDEDFLPLKPVFQSPYYYYIAPYTGCGCGWDLMSPETCTNYERNSKESIAQFENFLTKYIIEGEVEVISCTQNFVGEIPTETIEMHYLQFIENLTNLRTSYNENYAKKFVLNCRKIKKK